MTLPTTNRVQVQKYRVANQAVSVDTSATNGAVIGTNLFQADGTLVTQSAWNALTAPTIPTSGDFSGTTDDVDEGQYNLYFTIPRAQDAVGSILRNSGSVSLSYMEHTSITATADLFYLMAIQ